MLNRRNKYGWTALMLAARNQPEAVKSLCSLIAKRDKQQQFDILNQKSNDRWTALMLAAGNQPEVVNLLCSLIERLDKQQQVETLNQKDKYGRTALMLTARYHPEAVNPFCFLIAKLDEPQQVEVLNQKDKDGETVLMRAARCHSEAFNPFCSLIEKLDKPQQFEVLNQQDNHGETVLMIAAKNQPEAVKSLYSLIKNMEESPFFGEYIKSLYDFKRKEFATVNDPYLKRLKLLYHINKLEQKATVLQQSNSGVVKSVTIRRLCSKLKTSLDNCLLDESEYNNLATTWQREINNSRIILSQHRNLFFATCATFFKKETHSIKLVNELDDAVKSFNK